MRIILVLLCALFCAALPLAASGTSRLVEQATSANSSSLQEVPSTAELSAFECMTAAQIAAVRSYSYLVDVTTAVQSCIRRAWSSGRDLFVPAGGYLVATLELPGDSHHRGRAFRIHGGGPGEVYALVQNGFVGGTVFKSTTDAPVLEYRQDGPNTGSGTVEVDHLTFAGDTRSAYVVDFESLYEQSSFHHDNIFNAGTGGGFRGVLVGSADIYQNYAINRDWNTLSLGHSRVGIAFNILPAIDNGLTSLREDHAKGWHDGYNLGGGSGHNFSLSLTESEVSNDFNGVTIASLNNKATIERNYFEGVDGGTAIVNHGDSTSITNNLIFPGATRLVDDSDSGNIGTVISGNILSIGSVPSAIAIDIHSSGADGGPAKVIRDNYIAFSGSGSVIAGVNGITIAGIDPRITMTGNAFSPRGPWIGGRGTMAINDSSTSSNSSLTHGQFGFSTATNADQQYPALNQGVISLGVPQRALGDDAVQAGALDMGSGSYFRLTLLRPTDITSINAEQEGALVLLYCTNGNARFKQGANIQLHGSTDYTCPSRGAVMTFLISGSTGGRPIAREVMGSVEF